MGTNAWNIVPVSRRLRTSEEGMRLCLVGGLPREDLVGEVDPVARPSRGDKRSRVAGPGDRIQHGNVARQRNRTFGEPELLRPRYVRLRPVLGAPLGQHGCLDKRGISFLGGRDLGGERVRTVEMMCDGQAESGLLGHIPLEPPRHRAMEADAVLLRNRFVRNLVDEGVMEAKLARGKKTAVRVLVDEYAA